MSIEIAKNFVLETRMADPASYADGFTATFPDGMQLDGPAIVGTMQAILAAGPDFSFNALKLREEGDAVLLEIRVTATMTKTLSHPQFGDIPATGKKASLGVERVKLSFAGGKVASMEVDADGPAGPPELIRQWTA